MNDLEKGVYNILQNSYITHPEISLKLMKQIKGTVTLDTIEDLVEFIDGLLAQNQEQGGLDE